MRFRSKSGFRQARSLNPVAASYRQRMPVGSRRSEATPVRNRANPPAMSGIENHLADALLKTSGHRRRATVNLASPATVRTPQMKPSNWKAVSSS